MKKFLNFVLLCSLVLWAFAGPALAQDITSKVDFAPLLNLVIATVVSVAGAVGIPYAIYFFQKKLNIAVTPQLQQTLEVAMQNGLKYGADKVQGLVLSHGVTVDVKNEALAKAANYVVATVPDTMKKLKIDPDNLAAMLAARLHADQWIMQPTGTPVPPAPPVP